MVPLPGSAVTSISTWAPSVAAEGVVTVAFSPKTERRSRIFSCDSRITTFPPLPGPGPTPARANRRRFDIGDLADDLEVHRGESCRLPSGFTRTLPRLFLHLRPEARLVQQLLGVPRGVGVEGQHQRGAFGVGVAHVEVEDVYVV